MLIRMVLKNGIWQPPEEPATTAYVPPDVVMTHRGEAKTQCRSCEKRMKPDDWFTGKDMWHNCLPTCKHESFTLCPECWLSGADTSCVCGCQETYC